MDPMGFKKTFVLIWNKYVAFFVRKTSVKTVCMNHFSLAQIRDVLSRDPKQNYPLVN